MPRIGRNACGAKLLRFAAFNLGRD